MKSNKKTLIVFVFVIGILLMLSFVSAYMRSGLEHISTFGDSGFGSFQQFDKKMCEAGQDFIIQIAPFGCEPTPVRSDLLEEQNVAVFCKLGATKLNPLIDVKAIEQMTFTGEYPPEVSGVGFHPAQSALGYQNNLNSPLLNNIGYAVIVLKQQPNESAMPNFVSGNLTATIRYDIKNAFGIGKVSFYLPEMSDAEFNKKYLQYGFWDGRGYLRAESIEGDRATIGVYSDRSYPSRDGDKMKLQTVNLKEGELSREIFGLPGFDYCTGNFQLKLHDLEVPDTRVKLKINNDIFEVKDGEKFLDDKCWIKNIEKRGISQSVKIKCRQDDTSDPFVLRIEPKINLSFNGSTKEEYIVGDYLYNADNNNEKKVYLGYVGIDKDKNKFIIPVVSTARNSDEFKKTVLYNNLPGIIKSLQYDTGNIYINLIKAVFGVTGTAIFSGGEFLHSGDYPVGWIYEESSTKGSIGVEEDSIFEKLFSGLIINKIKFLGFAGPQDAEIDGDAKKYYEKALQDYETIQNSFSGTEYNEVSIEEKALFNLIDLSFKTGQKKTALKLCKKFKEKHSDKSLPQNCNNSMKLSSSEISSEDVFVNNAVKTISFEEIIEPSKEEYSAEVSIRGLKKGEDGKEDEQFNEQKMVLQKGVVYHLLGGDTVELVSLEDDSILVDFKVEQTLSSDVGNIFHLTGHNLRIKLHKREINIGKNNYVISVNKINLKKMAKVSIKPNIDYAKSTSKFKFKVEIEKRAIQLAPDKTKEKIEKLDKLNDKLEKISNRMHSTIKVLKGACLATKASLTVKNFFENTKGKGIARQEVMRGTGGWYGRCAEYVKTGEGNYKNIDECLIAKSDEIDKEVNLFYTEIQKQDKEIKNIQTDKNCYIQDNVFKGKVVNTTKFIDNYAPKVVGVLNGNFGEKINISLIKSVLNSEGFNEGKYNLDQLKKIELYSNILNSNAGLETKDAVRKRLTSVLTDVQKNSQVGVERDTLKNKFGVSEIDSGVNENSKKITFSKDILWKDIKSKFDSNGNNIGDNSFVRIYVDKSGSEKYLIQLDDDYIVNSTYSIGDENLPKITKKEKKNQLNLDYKKYDSSVYENKYTASLGESEAILRYYETAPYKGYPAIVPFDEDEGWYVAIKQTLGVAGNIRSYDESAKVNSFWLCNVGENHLEENIGEDDICEMINRGTRQPYNKFYGLEPGKVSQLVGRADNAIQSAQSQYEKAIKNGYAVIQGWKIKVGSPAVEIPDIQCEDSMSPKECNLLFNVCDPVMCPSSRCNFGGKYPVKDVVQSGIIGSIALCAPNFPQVKIPVCLTGVEAGLEGFTSVTTAYRDCLQKSLDTGENVGVCDEINSIYLCEFFWKQSLPLTKMIVPKIIETIMGQNSHGGGEYLGVKNAWENVENSINYFTKYYAVNSFKAFKARSSNEVGGSVCKVFTSVAYPDSGSLLNSLTEPDSPAQFSGKFDEILMTTATNPPISHYKVYYHIYSGKDRGAYYQIYLKGTQETSFYGDANSRYVVATGYIGKGEYASETKDKQLPSGYSEMCIVVNEHEECGFKQVSTSFAVNYVKDKYLEEQTSKTDIKTEKACVSGSASFYNLLNPNLQAGAESAISPEIYNRGITRICATKNPGKGTDSNKELFSKSDEGVKYSGRWQEVGYCGDQNIKCWLDIESVKDTIKFTNLKEDALEETTENFLENLRKQEGYLSEEEFKEKVKEVNKENNSLEKINLVKEILNKVVFDYEKSYLYLLRGNAYGKLAIKEYKIWLEKQPKREDEFEEVVEEDKGNLIWKKAKYYLDKNYDHCRIQDDGTCNKTNPCASFVTKVLLEVGIKTNPNLENKLGKGQSIDYLIKSIFTNGNRFEEISKNKYNDKLQKGDIIILGLNGEKTQHSSIFDSYVGNGKIKVISDPGESSPVEYSSYSIYQNNKKKGWYIYKAYRYFGSLGENIIIPMGYVSPSFEFHNGKINFMNKDPVFCFKFFQGEWHYKKANCGDSVSYTSSSGNPRGIQEIKLDFVSVKDKQKIESLNKENQDLIKKLTSKDYKTGLKLLISKNSHCRGLLGNKCYLKTENVEIDNANVVKVSQKGHSIYFYYDEKQKLWYWNPINGDSFIYKCPKNNGEKIQVLDQNVFQGYSFSEEFKNIILYLNSDSYGKLSSGIIFILDYLEGNYYISLEYLDMSSVDFKIRDEKKLKVLINKLNNDSISIEDKTCICQGNCDYYSKYIKSATVNFKLPDELLLLSLIMQESNCKSNAESNVGAVGLTQITKETFEDICKSGSFRKFENLKDDFVKQIYCGALILNAKERTYKNGLSKDSILNSCKEDSLAEKYSHYDEWFAGLRGYVGWGCTHPNYVEEIIKRWEELDKIYDTI